MIVQCPECTTKYNLDESKIGHDGTKVRCTRCKSVFTVFRPKPAEPAQPLAPAQAAPAAAAPKPPVDDFADDGFGDVFKDAPAAAAPKPAVDDFSDDGFDDVFKDAPAAAAPKPAVDDFLEDEFGDMFKDAPATPAPKPAPKPAVDESLEDELEALLDAGKARAASKPAAKDSIEDDLTAMLEERMAKAAPSRPVDREMLADLEGAFQQPLVGSADRDPLRDEDAPVAKGKKSGKTGLVLGLLMVLLVCAGAGVYFFRPALLGLGTEPPATPAASGAAPREGAAQIALENVRQYFVPNEKEGQLFIIEGKAVNRFPEARELIRLKASLFDSQGKDVASQEFMCGNVVSLYQLQVSSKADIEAALTAKVGILTNNTNIQPGASVPFMTVFFHAPETVEEFGLEVIQSTLPQQ
ncbi:DUF3426 domain-containing protein [Desulfomicrobium salsuginis]